MNILVIDTSQTEGEILLFSYDNLLGRKTFPPKEQTKFLIPLIDLLLTENLMTLKEIDLIKVCIGPGSFTGTRVGVITARSLAYGAKIPIVGFHSKTKAITASLEIVYNRS